MIKPLDAHRATSHHVDVRRLLVALILLGAASGAWYALRPGLVHRLARASVGHPLRSGLIRAALEDLYPQCPTARDSDVDSCRRPHSGFVRWKTASVDTGLSPSNLPGPVGYFGLVLADQDLRLLGWLRTDDIQLPLGGVADDPSAGRLMVVALQTDRHPPPQVSWERWAIVRLGGTANEIVGLLLIDPSVWPPSRGGRLFEWRRTVDGGQELGLFNQVGKPLGAAPAARVPVATFVLDSPDGVLRPREPLTAGGGLVWTPADGRPVRCAASDLLAEVAARLLPEPHPPRGLPTPSSRPTSKAAATSQAEGG